MVCGARAAQRHFWGLWGEELRAGEAGWRSCSSPGGSGSVVAVGRGAPDRGDPAWAALELSGVRKWRLIPPHPAVCRARGNQKQLKIPDFPFCLADRDAGSTGEETDRLSGCSSTFSRRLCTHSPGGEVALPALPVIYFSIIEDLAAADSPASLRRHQTLSETCGTLPLPGARHSPGTATLGRSFVKGDAQLGLGQGGGQGSSLGVWLL